MRVEGFRIYHLPNNWADNLEQEGRGGKLVGKLKIHFPNCLIFHAVEF